MYDAAAVPVNVAFGLAHGALRTVRREERGPGQPVKAPTMTWDEVRVGALRLLPGVRYHRHMLWRYSLMWRKPG